MKPLNALDRWVRGTRDGHRGATGGGWPHPDSATRCHGTRWEMAYSPRTCVTCRLHVRLHDMEILTRQFAPRVAGFRAGIHPHHALLRRHGPGTRGWKTVTHLKGREKALKPFGWTGRRAEWIVSDLPRLRGVHPRKVARFMDARPELLRRGMYADRAGLGRPGRPCPASGDRTSLPHIHARSPLPGAGA